MKIDNSQIFTRRIFILTVDDFEFIVSQTWHERRVALSASLVRTLSLFKIK